MDWDRLVHDALRLAAAFLLALPAAWERERAARSAGLRTFPLVAVGSCAYVLIARGAYPAEATAQSRVLEGLITGIGFVGGGAILRHGTSVEGTATAASVWAMGAVGAGVAYGRYEIALLVGLACVAILRGLRSFKRRADEELAPGGAGPASEAASEGAGRTRAEREAPPGTAGGAARDDSRA